MANVLIRNVSETTLKRLKERAARKRLSLQQELRGLLQEAAENRIEEFVASLQEERRRFVRKGRKFSDSTPLLREMRRR